TFSHAADKFTQSAQGIGSQVRDAGKLADQASDAAREASANVDRLRESSAAIGNVVNLIAQIARQTTLLALNSTIEAARAGEAGRAVTAFAQKLKARCAVLLRQGEKEGDRQDRRKDQRLPCSLKIEIAAPRGVISAPVYEISMGGILVSGVDAEALAQGQSFNG